VETQIFPPSTSTKTLDDLFAKEPPYSFLTGANGTMHLCTNVPLRRHVNSSRRRRQKWKHSTFPTGVSWLNF